MSLTTVYNTLETLYEMGEISKLDIDSDKAHFDPDNKRHHHFQCSSCKKIEYSRYLVKYNFYRIFKINHAERDRRG